MILQSINRVWGGYLKDKENNILFIFSGPLQVSTSLQAEVSAVLHLIRVLENSRFSKDDCVIYLDSEEVLQLVSKAKSGYEVDNCLVEPYSCALIRKPNIHFKHVSRRLNLGADDLAKQGKERKSLVQGWFL